MHGIYSNPKSGNVRMYRARKYASATAVKHTGTAMKGLGYAYYGVVAYQAYQNPKQIPKLLLAGIPQIGSYSTGAVQYNPSTGKLQGDIKSQTPPNPFGFIFD